MICIDKIQKCKKIYRFRTLYMATYDKTSSGSLFRFSDLVSNNGRPTLKSRPLSMESNVFRRWGKYWARPICLAVSSVNILFRNVFFTLTVAPDGRMVLDCGIGGSPSPCCRLSATTRKARRPILILCKYTDQSVLCFSNIQNDNVMVKHCPIPLY